MKIRTGGLVAAMMMGMLGAAQAQERPPITGIAFAHVFAAEPDASVAFYKSLGFVPETMGKTTRFAVSDSQWIDVDPLPQPAPAAHWDAMGFTTTDVRAMARYLQAKGVKITEPLNHGEIGVLDPEGNRVYFVQAGSYKRTAAQQMAKHESSRRIIHTGIIVRDRAAEDRFYREILGFTPYWYGGMTDTRTDFVSLQVPNGTDWLEYMMNQPASPTLQQAGMMDHFSLGVEHMSDAVASLAENHCVGENCSKTQMGRDGKVQLNVFDPDFTRIEFMEFKPSGPICCSSFTGTHPSGQEPK
jgi:catechol 2,3-dioxygenase-like lactoylglutathione lyase family enzyme